jgi:hypothetical protein
MDTGGIYDPTSDAGTLLDLASPPSWLTSRRCAGVERSFYSLVPKDYAANVKWRIKLQELVQQDSQVADLFIKICRKDILFYINSFVWVFDTRQEPFSRLPMITYPRQDECLRDIVAAMGHHSLRIEKSRDTGCSTLCVLAFEHCWHFSEAARHLLMASRTEEYVDKRDNPKSLFWKFDYALDNLPHWMKPKGYIKDTHRRSKHVENPLTGSVIDGESTTDNLARGDRRWAILLDEFAAFRNSRRVMMSTQAATPCRILNSTPNGINNSFYETKHMRIKNFTFHWKDIPWKAQGLYLTGAAGELEVVDKAGFPAGYTARLDGKLRSPWYDRTEDETSSTKEMGQEHDIDYLGSGGQFFDPRKLLTVKRQMCRVPMFEGTLLYDTTTAKPSHLAEQPNGRLQLWMQLRGLLRPNSEDRFVIGVDVAAGSGASNSCLSVWNERTQEKVGEYADPRIQPEALATYAVALATWFNNAKIIWEHLGPGYAFGHKVIDLGYRHVYWRKREEGLVQTMSDIAGWHPSKMRKTALLTAYRDALQTGLAVNRSRSAIDECGEYVYNQDGGVCHARSTNREDPSGAGSNHGDRVIADALAWKLLADDRPSLRGGEPRDRAEYGSLAWRIQQRERLSQRRLGTELPIGW